MCILNKVLCTNNKRLHECSESLFSSMPKRISVGVAGRPQKKLNE